MNRPGTKGVQVAPKGHRLYSTLTTIEQDRVNHRPEDPNLGLLAHIGSVITAPVFSKWGYTCPGIHL